MRRSCGASWRHCSSTASSAYTNCSGPRPRRAGVSPAHCRRAGETPALRSGRDFALREMEAAWVLKALEIAALKAHRLDVCVRLEDHDCVGRNRILQQPAQAVERAEARHHAPLTVAEDPADLLLGREPHGTAQRLAQLRDV